MNFASAVIDVHFVNHGRFKPENLAEIIKFVQFY